MTDKIYSIDEIKEIVTPIADRYGVERIFLFGSYSKGTQTKDSDIDIRIDGGKISGLFELSGFRLDIVEALDKEVDLLTTGGLDEKFLGRIKNDEVLIYGQRQADT